MTEEQKDALIASQQIMINNMMKVSTIQNALVSKLIDAFRLYMLDMANLATALGMTKGQTPSADELFKMFNNENKNNEPN